MLNKIKKVFSDRKEKREKAVAKFLADVFGLGFNKIQFPILIQEGHSLRLIPHFDYFISDVDIYHFEFERFAKLIDADGRQFRWGYNYELKTNFPDAFIQQLTLEELKEIADKHFKDEETRPEIPSVATAKEFIVLLSAYC